MNDIVDAAVAASKPHDHSFHPSNEDRCEACGRTIKEIQDRKLFTCTALINRKQPLPPW